MDPRTAEFYQSNADACLHRYESARMASLHLTLRRLVKPGGRVLEVGGGSGRDAACLASLGCRVTFTDGCPDMLDAACRQHPLLKEYGRVAAFPLEENDPLLFARFDVVLCLAVIMHLDDSDLCATASQIAQLTAPTGCAVISQSIGRLGLVDSRDSHGRLFRERTDAELLQAFTPFGFTPESRTVEEDGLDRSELQWITYVLRKAP
jgi:2-polyprenyl-3-methyl-5-hydroxy-6-metoxy-1,4-benzoquinol methylase